MHSKNAIFITTIEELEFHNVPEMKPLIEKYRNDLNVIQLAKGHS